MGLCFLAELREMSLWDILAWHRPTVTGIMLSGFLSLILFYYLMGYTMVTFLCRILQLSLLCGVFLGLSNRFVVTSDDIRIAVNRVVDCAVPAAVVALQFAYNLVTWRNYQLSGVVTVASFVVAFIGNYFSDALFIGLTILSAFTFPIVYERKGADIHVYVDKMRATAEKQMEKIKTKAGDMSKKAQ